jgi:hypothetical protein
LALWVARRGRAGELRAAPALTASASSAHPTAAPARTAPAVESAAAAGRASAEHAPAARAGGEQVPAEHASGEQVQALAQGSASGEHAARTVHSPVRRAVHPTMHRASVRRVAPNAPDRRALMME